MGVAYTADGAETPVQFQMCRRIRRRVEISFYKVAVQINQDDLVGRKLFVRNPAWLDCNNARRAVYCADVAPTVND